MNCSMSGFLVHHHLPEFPQTHVHWVSNVIQPSHLLSSPSPLALNLSQHQSLSQSVGFSHQVAKNIDNSASASVLPVNIQYWFPLGLTSLSSLLFKGLSKSLLQHHSSKAPILWRSAFFIAQLSYPYMTTRKTIALTMVDRLLSTKWCLCFLIHCLGLS